MVAGLTRGPQTYTELRVEFLPHPDSSLTYTTRATGDGVTAEGLFVNPLTVADLALVNLMPQTGGSTLQRSVARDIVDPIKDIGARLFDALFQGSLWRLYESSRSREDGLRLRLVVRDESAALPWELLYDRHRDDFLVLSTRSPAVRQVPEARRELPPMMGPRVRMLVVVSDPRGMIAAEAEIARIKHAERRGLLELDVLRREQASFRRFRQMLRESQYDIIHFSGNGWEFGETPRVRTASPRQALLFMTDAGTRSKLEGGEPVESSELIDALRPQATLRLVLLNACTTDAIAAQLARVVPATIGVRGAITDTSCLAFSEGFYRSAFDGDPLEIAITSGRLMIDSNEPGGREWSAPVAYLQSLTGEFLDFLRGLHAEAPSLREPASISAATQSQSAADAPTRAVRLLLEVHEKNLAALIAQKMHHDEVGTPAPDYLASQLATAAQEVDRLRLELAAGEHL